MKGNSMDGSGGRVISPKLKTFPTLPRKARAPNRCGSSCFSVPWMSPEGSGRWRTICTFAAVAQWQSSRLVSGRSSVRFRPAAPNVLYARFPPGEQRPMQLAETVRSMSFLLRPAGLALSPATGKDLLEEVFHVFHVSRDVCSAHSCAGARTHCRVGCPRRRLAASRGSQDPSRGGDDRGRGGHRLRGPLGSVR